MHPAFFASLVGLQQIVCWGTLTYAAAVFAPAMAQACGIGVAHVMTAYGVGLLTNAFVAPMCTRWVLRAGAFRPALLGLVLLMLACLVLSQATHAAIVLLGFMIAGMAMALTQYDFAFLTVSLHMPAHARRVITLITFYGALASTIMWPTAVALAAQIGVSRAWIALGVICWVVSLPAVLLAYRLPIVQQETIHTRSEAASPTAPIDRASPVWIVVGLIGLMLMGNSIVANLPIVLGAMQTPSAHLAWILSLFGMGQLASRALDYATGRWFSIRTTVCACCAGLVVALTLMAFTREQAVVAAVFTFVLGAANGLTAILRGVVPQQLFNGKVFAHVAAQLARYGAVGRAVAPVLVAYVLALHHGLTALATLYVLVTLLCGSILWQQIHRANH